ncbi:MAG TPA: ABC transporter ATP-binding protein [Anaerolineae bacterium]|nr:ABC transporter ATP-binding protein [Anaerolineae bacterium]MCB9102824.1 ABC transporter ATP-binding protein [Anaerolineales bacterium]HRV94503.1 ABC transporter ATP-binding protein [Anaerolineae bacterium]
MIEIENITKHFGNKAVIQNVNFKVEKGETVGLYGQTGAGKTTLIRVLTAYMFPSSGKLTILGYNILSHSHEIRRRVGYLPQGVSLYGDMTVENYLTFVARLHRVNDRHRRVCQVIEEFQLSRHTKTLIGKLPLDLHRRVGLAQAVVFNPEILILDQPTAGLAPDQIMEIYQFIKPLTNQYTVFLSTHTWCDVEQFCDRVLMMDKGRIVGEKRLKMSQRRVEPRKVAEPGAISILAEALSISINPIFR